MKSASSFFPFRAVLSLVGCAISIGGFARAQTGTTPSSSTSCNGKTIHEIRVAAQRPPFKGETAHWRRFARSIGLHHATTDTVVIRRFLTLETGGECSDFRLRESARLLRAQPFLAEASVRSVPDGRDGVRIEVETTDEISALASASFGSGRISYLEIGNENMFGQAWLLAVHRADRQLEGQSAGFRASDFQFLNKPYQLDVAGDWGERTTAWYLDAFHGYLTDLQRIAWEVGLGHAREALFALSRGENRNALALQFRGSAADLGGILKFGNLKTPILLGGMVTMTRREPLGAFSITRNGFTPDTALLSRYPRISRTRVSGVGGWRNLNFITVQGFNALTATEDAPTGVQLFGQLGRGTHSLGGASDAFLLGDILAGVGSGRTYSELTLITEGRREIGNRTWDGIVSSGLLGVYWKPNDPNLLRAWGEFAGGWRVQVPFQLGLNTENQRLLGYRAALFGGRRAAAGVLVRHIVRGMTTRGDFGFGAFVNAVRLWAGDAAFGTDTPILPSVGVSLFAAVPHGSQRTLRIDFGTALRRGIPRSGWEVRLTYRDFTRTVRSEPADVARAREQLIGQDVFRP